MSHTLEGHLGAVVSCCMFNDASKLLSWSENGELCVSKHMVSRFFFLLLVVTNGNFSFHAAMCKTEGSSAGVNCLVLFVCCLYFSQQVDSTLHHFAFGILSKT